MAKSIAQRIEGCPDSMSTPDFKIFEALVDNVPTKMIVGVHRDSDLSSLENYLTNLGIEKDSFHRIKGLKKVLVSLTKGQIYEVAKLDYVNSVFGDQIIYGYHTPKRD